jgi:hypothetical protein
MIMATCIALDTQPSMPGTWVWLNTCQERWEIAAIKHRITRW